MVEKKILALAAAVLVACVAGDPAEPAAGMGGSGGSSAPGGASGSGAGGRGTSASGGSGHAGDPASGGSVNDGGAGGGNTAGADGGGAGSESSAGAAGEGGGGDTGGNAGSGGAGGGGTGGTNGKIVVQGSAQKGPLLGGSNLLVSMIDDEANSTGVVFSTTTSDDEGHFNLTLNQPGHADLSASGFYFNEITGKLSVAPIALHALAELDNAPGSQSIFVNVLTHLASNRGRTLIKQGQTLHDATAAAEAQLKSALGIYAPGNLDAGTALDLLGGDTADNAFLLALSCMLGQAAVDTASSPTEVDAKLQQLINQIALDLGPDGLVSASLVNAVKSGSKRCDVFQCSAHMQARIDELGSPAVVPNILRGIDWDDDGISDFADPDADGDGIPKADDVAVSVASWRGQALLADSSGNAWWWQFEQLGSSWETPVATKTAPLHVLEDIALVGIDDYRSYAVTRDGTLLTWMGADFGGAAPVPGAVDLATSDGSFFTTRDTVAIALKADGTVLRIGNGQYVTELPGLSSVTQIAPAGPAGSGLVGIALRFEDGSAGFYRGDGGSTVSPLTDAQNVVAFASTNDRLYVLEETGDVYEYQFDATGVAPGRALVDEISNVSVLAGGTNSVNVVLATDVSGQVWSLSDLEQPKPIEGLTDVVRATTVQEQWGVALKSDGSLWWFPIAYVYQPNPPTPRYDVGSPHQIYLPR